MQLKPLLLLGFAAGASRLRTHDDGGFERDLMEIGTRPTVAPPADPAQIAAQADVDKALGSDAVDGQLSLDEAAEMQHATAAADAAQAAASSTHTHSSAEAASAFDAAVVAATKGAATLTGATATVAAAGVSPYNAGFNSFKVPKPDYPAQMAPTVVDFGFENSAMSSAVGLAVEDTLARERPLLHTKLKANALAAAKKFAASTSTANAKAAADNGYKITSKMLTRKAFTVCQKMSRMGTLPVECAKEAAAMFKVVKTTSSGTWATQVAAAARPDTEAAASRAAYEAVQHFPGSVMPEAAYKAARIMYDTEMAKYKQQYEKATSASIKTLISQRATFWTNAQKDIENKVKAEVKKVIWDQPILDADKIIAREAKKQAHVKSAKLVTAALAPQFVAAAKDALTKGARAASASMMTEWNPDWALQDGETAGEMPGAAASAPQSWDVVHGPTVGPGATAERTDKWDWTG
mmetsp:Transcript_42783/g.93381  ORF Transcript_42783/g.93381 Transcript_42783/m.93381 type:complete len:466 (+) Transcript_42783:140-1537(+)